MTKGIEGTDFMPVKAGQEARIAPGGSKPRIIAAAAPSLGHDPAAGQADRSTIPPARRGRGIPSVFAQNTELAVLVGGLVVTGGTLGGLAASGVFDGNDNEGSQFK